MNKTNYLFEIFGADFRNNFPLAMGMSETMTIGELEQEYKEKGEVMYQPRQHNYMKPLHERI